MGKIQGAINGALGTAAASMVAIGHAKSTSEQKAQSAENTAVVAEGQAANAVMESYQEEQAWEHEAVDTGRKDAAGNPVMRTKAEMHHEAEGDLARAQTKFDEAKAGYEAGTVSEGTFIRRKNALQAAQDAFNVLDTEQTAIRVRGERANQMMEHALDLRERANEAQARHEKLWGGKK